LTGVKCDLALA